MKKNILETFIGAFVLLLALFFAIYAYHNAGVKSPVNGYKLIAKFDHIDGIITGSDVKLAGIKIGEVTKLSIDQENYQAIIELVIAGNIKLPIDSSAQIISESLLGGKYIALTPGNDALFLKAGSEVKYTQSSMNIENLIGKFMFSDNKEKK